MKINYWKSDIAFKLWLSRIISKNKLMKLAWKKMMVPQENNLTIGTKNYTVSCNSHQRGLITKSITVLSGIVVCATLNMTTNNQGDSFLRRLERKLVKYVEGNDYKTISQQLDVPVTTAEHIIQKFKVHSHPPLDWPQKENWWQIEESDNRSGKQRAQTNLQRDQRWTQRSRYISVRSHHAQLSKPKCARRRSLLKAYHKKAGLEFAKMHIDKPQSWENVYGQIRQNWSLLVRLCVHRQTENEAYKERNTEEAWWCSGAALLHAAQGVWVQ